MTSSAYVSGMGSLPLQTLYLEMLDRDGKCLSHGTAFLVQVAYGLVGLITARHNLTATDIFTGKPLGNDTELPKSLKIWLPSRIGQSWFAVSVDLEQRPWLDYETFGVNEKSDVALLLLDFGPAGQNAHLFEFQSKDEITAFGDWQTWNVGAPMTVFGYPIRRFDQKSAIGVAGQLATEPRIDFHYQNQSYPMYLVSARTWSGMSGGPVVPREGPCGWGFHCGSWISAAGGGAPIALGCYGGRLPVLHGETSDLAMIWRINWLVKLVAQRQRESPPLPVHNIEFLT